MTVSAVDEPSLRLLKHEVPTIQTLIKGCTGVDVVSSTSDVPSGCLAESINSTITAHLLVAGVLDLKKEIAKSEKRIEALKLSADRLQTQMDSAGNKLKEDVREANQVQLANYESEIETLRKQIQDFSTM